MSDKPGSAGGGDKQPRPKSPAAKNKKKRIKKTVQGSVTPDPIKAQIIAMILSGAYSTDKQIAQEVGTTPMTVSRIKKYIPSEYLLQLVTKKDNKIAEKIEEFLTTTLDSLKAINTVTSKEEWIEKQDAAGLTIFFGTKADKVAKILEAIERANEPRPDEVVATETT